MVSRAKLAGGAVLGLGYLFLFIPILSVVVYSFNESRLVTVWQGFSTKWYGELLHDERVYSMRSVCRSASPPSLRPAR